MSHRDLADLGTHLSPENRDSYVRDADVHLSLWSFRDSNNSPGTLPARGGFVNNASPPPRSRGPDKILPAKGARRITHLSDFWKALGEVPVAVVVHRGEIEGDDLIAWVAERVAPHKRIRAVRFVEAIPKTPSGKVLRQILVERDRQSTGVTSS